MNFWEDIIVKQKVDPRIRTRMMRADDVEQVISVIIFTKNLECKTIEENIYKLNGKIKYKLPLIRAIAVEMPYKYIKNIAMSREVIYVSDDVEVQGLLDIASPTVKAPECQRQGYTGEGITAAILDTGVYPHPDLVQPKNRIIGFKDFINGINKPYDDNGHGTHVAGDMAGNGLSSQGKYTGIAPNVNLVVAKVLNNEGNGSTSDIVAGMQWVVDNKNKYGIRILSLSLGSAPSPLSTIDPMLMAVKSVWNSGIVVVAAAGNSGPKEGTIVSPGISPIIITVGAADDKGTVSANDDIVAPFSSRGVYRKCKNIDKPDVVAPGVNITSLAADTTYLPSAAIDMHESSHEVAVARKGKQNNIAKKGEYKTMSGTSFATPIVSGAIALLLQKNPKLTPDDVKNIVLASAIKLKDQPKTAQGKGMINIETMLAKANYQSKHPFSKL